MSRQKQHKEPINEFGWRDPKKELPCQAYPILFAIYYGPLQEEYMSGYYLGGRKCQLWWKNNHHEHFETEQIKAWSYIPEVNL